MIILISGASHTGKTYFAKEILKKHHYNYLSLDLLKMGLIRSGYTKLTALDNLKLTNYLWPIVKNIIKTAIENNDNLVIEGGYIPFGYHKDFNTLELEKIKHYCLVMSESYIKDNFKLIKSKADVVEKRIDDSFFTLDFALKDNNYYLNNCLKYNYNYILIDKDFSYKIDLLKTT